MLPVVVPKLFLLRTPSRKKTKLLLNSWMLKILYNTMPYYQQSTRETIKIKLKYFLLPCRSRKWLLLSPSQTRFLLVILCIILVRVIGIYVWMLMFSLSYWILQILALYTIFFKISLEKSIPPPLFFKRGKGRKGNIVWQRWTIVFTK